MCSYVYFFLLLQCISQAWGTLENGDPPPPVTGTFVSNITSSSANISWYVPPSLPQFSYLLLHIRMCFENTYTSCSNYATTNISADLTSYVVDNLSPALGYQYYITTNNVNGESTYSISQFITLFPQPTPMRVANITSFDVTIEWDTPENVDVFYLYRSTNNQSFTSLAQRQFPTSRVRITGLYPEDVRYYKYYVGNSFVTSDFSDAIFIKIPRSSYCTNYTSSVTGRIWNLEAIGLIKGTDNTTVYLCDSSRNGCPIGSSVCQNSVTIGNRTTQILTEIDDKTLKISMNGGDYCGAILNFRSVDVFIHCTDDNPGSQLVEVSTCVYSYHLYLMNNVCDSFFASKGNVTIPTPYPVVVYNITAQSASISWLPVYHASFYRLKVRNDQNSTFENVYVGDQLLFSLAGLASSTRYYVIVEAVASINYFAQSEEQLFTTLASLHCGYYTSTFSVNWKISEIGMLNTTYGSGYWLINLCESFSSLCARDVGFCWVAPNWPFTLGNLLTTRIYDISENNIVVSMTNGTLLTCGMMAVNISLICTADDLVAPIVSNGITASGCTYSTSITLGLKHCGAVPKIESQTYYVDSFASPYSDCQSPQTGCPFARAYNLYKVGDIIHFIGGIVHVLDSFTIEKNLVLKGDGIGLTVLACPTVYGEVSYLDYESRSVRNLFNILQPLNVTFIDLSITNCLAYGGGIRITGSYVSSTVIKFHNCSFYNSTMPYAFLGDEPSAVVVSTQNLEFANCLFHGNIARTFINARLFSLVVTKSTYSVDTPYSQFTNCSFANNIVLMENEEIFAVLVHSDGVVQFTNCTFLNNSAKSSNVVRLIQNNMEGRFSNCVFLDNYVEVRQSSFGGIYNGFRLFVSDSTFANNSLTMASGHLVGEGATFDEDFKVLGAVLYVTGALEVSSSVFIANSLVSDTPGFYGGAAIASYSGRGLYSYAMSVADSVFIGNGVLVDLYGELNGQNSFTVGGAVYSGSPTAIYNCAFQDNFAKSPNTEVTVNGGAIYIVQIDKPYSWKVTNSVFTNNYVSGVSSTGSGGAVYSSLAPTLSNVTFYGNYVEVCNTPAGGGALAVKDTYSLRLKDCVFTNNFILLMPCRYHSSEPAKGGALCFERGTTDLDTSVWIANSNFSENFVRTSAAGVSTEAGAVYVDSPCYIQNNSFSANFLLSTQASTARGGALSLRNGQRLLLENCSFLHNHIKFITNESVVDASGGGGAVHIVDSAISIVRCFFHYSSVTDAFKALGGAVFLVGSLVDLHDCVLVDNSAVGYMSDSLSYSGGDAYGGALYTIDSVVTLANCKFEHNIAVGGSVQNKEEQNLQFSVGFTYCGSGFGGAIYIQAGYTLGSEPYNWQNYNLSTIVNCSFYNNAVAGGVFRHAERKRELADGHAVNGAAHGGAIFAYLVSIASCEFMDNHARSLYDDMLSEASGGAVAVVVGNFQECYFLGNSAGGSLTTYGGALLVYQQANIESSLFETNSAYNSEEDFSASYGGAVATGSIISNPNALQLLIIDNSHFLNNIAGFGGAIYVNSSAILSQSFVIGNTAHKGGGGILIGNSALVSLANVTVVNNTAEGYGPDFASLATKLILKSPEAKRVVTWPGRIIEIEAYITDAYNDTVFDAAYSMTLGCLTDPQFSSGQPNDKVDMSTASKSFVFKQISVNSKTNSPHTLSIHVDAGGHTFDQQLIVFVQDCPPGYFTLDSGMCSRCSPLKYKIKGEGECESCPDGANCLILNEYPATATDVQTGRADVTEASSAYSFTISQGSWPEPSTSGRQWRSIEKLIKCPNRDACEEYFCRIALGSTENEWDIDCTNSVKDSAHARSSYCYEGFDDRLCTKCVCNDTVCYYPSEGFKCNKCHEEPVAETVLVFICMALLLVVFARTVLFFVFLCLVAIIFLASPSFGNSFVINFVFIMWILKVQMNTPPESGFYAILLNYLQVLYALSVSSVWYTTRDTQGSFIQKVADLFVVININLSSVECVFSFLSPPVYKYLFSMLFPLLLMILMEVILALNYMLYHYLPRFMHRVDMLSAENLVTLLRYLFDWAIYGMKKLAHRGRNAPPFPFVLSRVSRKPKNYVAMCLNGLLMLLLYSYFGISVLTFRVLQPCSSDNYMQRYPWIVCGSRTYVALQVLAGIFCFIYVIGTPVLLFSVVFIAQKKKTLNSEFTLQTIGFVYACFKNQNPYFFLVLMTRRVIISAIVAVVTDILWMNWTIMIVLAVFSLIHSKFQLFKNNMENYFQSIEVMVLIITFTCIQTLEYNTGLFVTAVVINIVLIVALVVKFLDFKAKSTSGPQGKPMETELRHLSRNPMTPHSWTNI